MYFQDAVQVYTRVNLLGLKKVHRRVYAQKTFKTSLRNSFQNDKIITEKQGIKILAALMQEIESKGHK